MLETLAIAAMGAGTVMQIQATRQQGEQAQKIAESRAAIDRQNAEMAEKAAIAQAGITKERGRRLIERQKGVAAAAGIRINVGSPLVIEAETEALIAQDIGYILERGREGKRYYESSAALEIATGKAAKKQAKRSAWATGIMGFGSIAYMGAESGMFNGKTNVPLGRGGAVGSLQGRNVRVTQGTWAGMGGMGGAYA